MGSLRIAVRTDGDERIGAGHVARCLPLAQAFAGLGHEPVFVGSYSGVAAELLARAGIESVPADRGCPSGVSLDGCDAAILDSYEIAVEEICWLAHRRPIVTLAESHRCAEEGVLLDYHFDRRMQQPTRRLLPGPCFAPIDPRFVAARRPRPEVKRVLVTTGASSLGAHLAATALEAVLEAFPQASVLSSAQSEPSRAQVEQIPPGTPLWEVLPEVDLAVSAAGVTAYELACAGVPAVLVAFVENQRRVAAGCAATGTALAVDAVGEELPNALLAALSRLRDRRLREQFSKSGTTLLDGKGSVRAANSLLASWRQ